jgi:H+/Cl- antiporter ClcA
VATIETGDVGRTATIIAVSYTIVCVVAIVLLALIAASTRGRRTLDAGALKRLGEREKMWFAIVVVLLVTVLFATIFFTPYGRGAGPDAQVEKIAGLQFAWLVPGKPVGCIYSISRGGRFVFVDESAEQIASSNRRRGGLAVRRRQPAGVGRL